MKPSRDLFALIQSMSPREKRLFRLRAKDMRRETDSNFLILFNLIASQTEYDEQQVKAKLAGAACLGQFTRAKNYLYDRILKTLRQFHEEKSARGRCLAVLEGVEVLTRRQLYAQAAKKLKTGLRIANNYALTDQVPALLAWQRNLLKRQNVPKLAEALEALEKKEADAIRLLQREQQLRALYDRFLVLSKKRRGPKPNAGETEAATLARLRTHPALAYPASQLTFNAKLAHHLCLALYHRLRGEIVAAHARYREVRCTWEAHPKLLAAFPDRYLRAVSAFLYSCHSIAEYSEFAPLLERIEQDASLSGVDKTRIRVMSYNLRLLYQLNQPQLRPAPTLTAALANELTETRLPLSLWISATINLALYHFMREDFRNSSKWFRAVLALPRGKEGADLREFARLLLLFNFYELDHLDLLAYELKAFHRFLQTQHSINPLETAVRKFFRYIDRHPGIRDRATALRMLEADMCNPQLDMLMGAEEVRIWVESRLHNQTLVEVHAARRR